MLAPTMFFADYGCHVRILEESIVLREMGHKVEILTYPNGRDIANLNIRRSVGVPFNYRIEVGSSRHKIYLDMLLGLKSLLRVIVNKPDIIHAHLHEGALLGWLLSKLTKAPLIFDFQGSLTAEMTDHNFIKHDSLFLKPLYWLEEQIDHSAKAVLTSSFHAARLLQKEFGVSPGRVHPTPDSVNSDTFSSALFSESEKLSLKQQLVIPTEKQVLVYLGLLTEYQGTGHLLKALQIIKSHRQDVHLLLMGFPAVKYYQAIAHELGVADSVTFTGKIFYEDAPRYLALGDIAIAPKLSATEGSGKILNYMSMALPTVAFDTPVSREYLRGYGIYAKKHTPESLAIAINDTLDIPLESRQKLGNMLRKRVMSRYTWQKVGKQIETVYTAVLAGHPQPAFVVDRATI